MFGRHGGRWGNAVYHVPVTDQHKNLAIKQLEMLNTLVALKIFASIGKDPGSILNVTTGQSCRY